MKLASRDADFRPEPELSAIGELGRGIVEHDRAVDLAEESLGRAAILGNDRVGVLRAMLANVADRPVEAARQLLWAMLTSSEFRFNH